MNMLKVQGLKAEWTFLSTIVYQDETNSTNCSDIFFSELASWNLEGYMQA